MVEWLYLLGTLVSIGLIIRLVMIAAGFYKEPVLHGFERYAQMDDSYHLLPPLLLAVGLLVLFGGMLFASTVANRFSPIVFALLIFLLAYYAHDKRGTMAQHPNIFLSFPRWYVELRSRTTREERRRIAYMWLSLPKTLRLHYNGSDHHFLLWCDLVILGTITQTVEDQEAKLEYPQYIPDLHGRRG